MIQARYNKVTKQYRCGMDDCNALLAIGGLEKGGLEIKCKCGAMNVLPVVVPVPGSGPPRMSYQNKVEKK